MEVNVASEEQPLIYDFYGFPAHFYRTRFPNHGDAAVASSIIALLGKAGFKGRGVERGLDHGVWASFMCAFNPQQNPLGEVPIVQVSLLGDENGAKHVALGTALAPLREEGVLIIGSGMAVHNLRDFRRGYGMPPGQALPYVRSFDEALKAAVETEPGEKREVEMLKLLERKDLRQAHPSLEHLLPVFVAAGAAEGEGDEGKQIWTEVEGSLSWGMFRFG